MLSARCPICDRIMEGASAADWPYFPFCGERCKRIDLGRWLGESYRVPVEASGDNLSAEPPNDTDIP